MMRLWERVFRRAQIPLAYSEGFSPHPRMSLAVPLAVGVTSEAELMDVVITKWASPHWFTNTAGQQLPPGIGILGVYQIALTMPSLQSQVRYAEYRVEVATEKGAEDIESAVSSLLALGHLPWHHVRDTGRRDYDLRALIDDLWLIARQPSYGIIGMRLRCDSGGSGRPEQVTLALGFPCFPQSVHRTKLLLEARK